MRSESGPATPLAALESGFADVELAGQPWRVFTLRSREGLRVCLQDLSIGHLRLAVNTGGLEALQVLHADAIGDAGDAAAAAERNPSPNS